MTPINRLEHPEKLPTLGREWVGPGLVATGVLALGRVEVLGELAVAHRGIAPELARWGQLASIEPILIQALVMGMVGAALLFGTRGPRRLAGFLLAGLIFLSALSGWPVADQAETARSGDPGIAGLWILAGLAFGESAILAAIAIVSSRSAGARRLLCSLPALLLLGVGGLGVPTWVLWNDAQNAPTMPVREVVAELVGVDDRWTVIERPESADEMAPVITPYNDWRLTAAEHDTGDKAAMIMPPPCELTFTVTDDDGLVDLIAAAQIDFEFSQRWPNGEGMEQPSRMDRLGIDSISVRFEVLVDGSSVFDETISHRSQGDGGDDRLWHHVGEERKLPLRPGQTVTLRTSFGDPDTRALIAAHPTAFRCGFGDLVLERWHEQPRQRASAGAPNLVFIVMDTLRADRVSCYGYEKLTTPHLDALARRGLLFENAFATSSWTWPSTASLLTGLLPYEHGVLSNAACNLNLSYQTVAECLQTRGYTTAAISCNPLIDPARHFDQGFESFDSGARMRMTDEVIEEIESTIDRIADTRFFLYLHLADPHTPHRPLPSELERLGGEAPEDYPDEIRRGIEVDGMDHYAMKLNSGAGRDPDGEPHPERVVPEAHLRWMNDRYDASVGTGDHFLGQILERLDSLGLTEKTIIVFTSDHGEEFLDHGMLAHGHALWRELVRVPLIIAGPGLPQGARMPTEVSNRHLAPTLAMLGGGKLVQLTDARNLIDPTLEATPIFYQTEKGYWNGHLKRQLLGLRDDRYIIHHAPEGGSWKQQPPPGGQVRLFDLLNDPLEQVDLAIDSKRREEFAAPRVKGVTTSRSQQEKRKQGIDVPVGGEGWRALGSLGYLGGSVKPEETRDDQPPPEDSE
jgi:arylsulfatase A-like enzyme